MKPEEIRNPANFNEHLLLSHLATIVSLALQPQDSRILCSVDRNLEH